MTTTIWVAAILVGASILYAAQAIATAIQNGRLRIDHLNVEESRELEERLGVARIAAILAAGDVQAGPNAYVRAPAGDSTLGRLRDDLDKVRAEARAIALSSASTEQERRAKQEKLSTWEKGERDCERLLAEWDVFSRGSVKYVDLAWAIYDEVGTSQRLRRNGTPPEAYPTPTRSAWMASYFLTLPLNVAERGAGVNVDEKTQRSRQESREPLHEGPASDR